MKELQVPEFKSREEEATIPLISWKTMGSGFALLRRISERFALRFSLK